MTPAKPWTSVIVGALSSLVFWVGLDLWTNGGGTRPPLSLIAPVSTLVLVVVVLAAGWPVRRYLRGQGRVEPLVAARTAVLAKAAAYVGAVLAGWYVGQAGVLLPDLVGVRRSDLVVALVAVGSAVLLVVAGFVVQHWCRLPPEDDEVPQR